MASGTRSNSKSASMEDLTQQMAQMQKIVREHDDQIEDQGVMHQINMIGGNYMLPEQSKIKNHQLTIFEGNPDESFTEWYELFDLVTRDMQADKKAIIMATCLRKHALLTYRGLPAATRSNYGNLVKAMKEKIDIPEYQAIRQTNVMTRTQQDNESVSNFASDLQNLYRLAFSDNTNENAVSTADDPVLRNIFLQGLRSEIYGKLAFERLKTFEDAKLRAMTIEATLTNMKNKQMIENHNKITVRSVNYGTVEPGPSKAVSHNNNDMQHKLDEMTRKIMDLEMQLCKLTRENTCNQDNQQSSIGRSDINQNNNYNSFGAYSDNRHNNDGHYNQNFLNGQDGVCFNCGNFGHFARECGFPNHRNNNHRRFDDKNNMSRRNNNDYNNYN